MSRAEFEIERRRSDSARAKGRLTLTRADVIKAGTQLLDTEGVEKLSMRKLAKTLGTVSSTLYWHVKDKDELAAVVRKMQKNKAVTKTITHLALDSYKLPRDYNPF